MKKKEPNALIGLAESLVSYGRKKGADEIEVSVTEGNEFSVDIRLGEIENLVEASSRSVGIRVIKDQKTAFATSSDLKQETLQGLVRNAVLRAEEASSDACAGLPECPELTADIPSLGLFDPEIPGLEVKKKIELALETERIALLDKRIANSHGASFETREAKTILANSKSFCQDYQETLCSLDLGLQAGETDNLVEDQWSSTVLRYKDLEPPETVAKKAVQRTVRQLNPRKLETANVPVIFEPLMTSWLLGFLFACVSGMAIYQKASWLVDKLGERIGNEKITVIDDGLMPGKLGTRPFDSEGVPTRRTTVIEKGILKNYLCNTYAARKLALRSTGNAEGNIVGPNNFYLAPGDESPESMVSSLNKGLILIRTIGHGLNPVTGEISRGAFGLWVENGEVAFPVSEVTISGNLGKILNQVETVGNDLEFRSLCAGPTLKIRELTVAGR